MGSKAVLLEPDCCASSGYKQGSWKELQHKGDAEDLGTWAEVATGGNSRSGEEQKNWRRWVMS